VPSIYRCAPIVKGDEEDAFSGPVAKMMDGLYSKEGYRIKYGVFKEKVEPPAKMSFAEYMDASEEVRQSRQAEAAKELVNIDKVGASAGVTARKYTCRVLTLIVHMGSSRSMHHWFAC
jgi:hypothetical protein